MIHTHSKEPDAHKSNPQKSDENFQDELRNLRRSGDPIKFSNTISSTRIYQRKNFFANDYPR